MQTTPDWLAPAAEWRERVQAARTPDVVAALAARTPGVAEFSALISPAAAPRLDALAERAAALTAAHFGNTITLYVPLYLSNYCSGGCAYCGFSSDRRQPRRRLEHDELIAELLALKAGGFDDVLLLTGERTPQADFDYLERCVALAATHVSHVAVEAFAMTGAEYARLRVAGCAGLTLYQETYDPRLYAEQHRWGEKRDFAFRLGAPERALAAGLRTVGLGALLGLGDPFHDAIALFLHARRLQRDFWQAGVSISFPRLCHEAGGFQPARPVSDRELAQFIFAFRICLPDVPLVLSTREKPRFRDGIAGIGISRMSAGSRTTVGGYRAAARAAGGQFDVNDSRDVETFCAALRRKGLDPVFKNWDAAFQ